jgi:hypothetical protein
LKVKLALETMSDISEFVNIANKIKTPINLTGGDFKVSAKSLLGVIYAMEWQEVWCECSEDIYSKIEKFVV